MSDDDLAVYVGEGSIEEATKPAKRLASVVADAYAFIRSEEASAAIAEVTLEQLINDQILRNGDSERSNKSKYDPYSYDPKKTEAASEEPTKRANFPGGSDTGRPTKLDRVLAIVNNIADVVSQIKSMEVDEVVKEETWSEKASIAAPED
jgi:hypothetical protein